MDNNQQCSLDFSAEWLGGLLDTLEQNCSSEECKIILNQCSEYHYKTGYMDEILKKYVGDLHGFIEFVSKEWNQIITYNEDENIILVDENKDFCVCPIKQSMGDKKVSPILCHCSEGFTAKIMSTILGKEVKSRVINSVLRGDKSCVYEIKI